MSLTFNLTADDANVLSDWLKIKLDQLVEGGKEIERAGERERECETLAWRVQLKLFLFFFLFHKSLINLFASYNFTADIFSISVNFSN